MKFCLHDWNKTIGRTEVKGEGRHRIEITHWTIGCRKCESELPRGSWRRYWPLKVKKE